MHKNNLSFLVESAFQSVSENYAIEQSTSAIGAQILSNEIARDNFLSSLAEGLNDSQVESFKTLAANSMNSRAQTMLFENNAAQLAVFSTLDQVILREVFDRIGAKEAMSYEALKVPTKQIAYLRQYMTLGGAETEKISIPQALSAMAFKGETCELTFDLSQGKQKNVFTELNYISQNKSKFASMKNMTLSDFGVITELTCHSEDNYGGKATKVPVNIIIGKIGAGGMFTQVISWQDDTGVQSSDTLMGSVNRQTGDVTFATIGTKIKNVKYSVKVSQETNQKVYDLKKEFERITITVGDGDTINTALPVQFAQDTKALFGMDAISECAKTMSDTFDQIYDMHCYNTFASAVTSKEQEMTFNGSMMAGGNHIGISQQMHNAGLAQMVFDSIAAIDSRNNFGNGTSYYVLINPKQNAHIAGLIAPEYAGAAGAAAVYGGGVLKNYNNSVVGTYSGGEVKVLSSKHYNAGEMYVVAKPVDPSHICFGYYDYSQVLMPAGTYRNEQNALVPNIAMIKRKEIYTFRPEASQKINVINDGERYQA